MSLLYPSFLWLLIPLAIFLWRGSTEIVTRVHLIILILLTIALSRPVIKHSAQEVEIEGRDLIIALDVSYSMNAQDIKPNRYDFAKGTILSLLEQNPANNVMMMVFTTNPLLLSPPTTDHQLIEIALDSLNRKFILTRGTSLKNLFDKLGEMKIENKEIILLTDGGEESNQEELIALIEQNHLSINILALGTKEGSTITKSDNTLLKDQEGNLVVSRINPILASLGQSYTPQSTPKATADKIYNSLIKQETKSSKQQYLYTELYQIILLIAIILFLMVHTRWVKYLILIESNNNKL